jgi:uncharacterized protein
VITYIDTSSLLKLVIEEEGSDRAALIWDAADVLASVGLIVVEARAALAAAERGGRLTGTQHQQAKHELADLIDNLHVIGVTDDVIAAAADLAEGEGLRGYDAVHLAGAILVEASLLTSADEALCEAAGRRGLHVANPLAPAA